jgi:NIMA (never in mitosis gene a)-related kinase
MLDGLEPKEQESCLMEVNLLSSLEHPNIVAYKESFFSSNHLIIIMEYCEGKHKTYVSAQKSSSYVFMY